jgi:hypothetical protein
MNYRLNNFKNRNFSHNSSLTCEYSFLAVCSILYEPVMKRRWVELSSKSSCGGIPIPSVAGVESGAWWENWGLGSFMNECLCPGEMLALTWLHYSPASGYKARLPSHFLFPMCPYLPFCFLPWVDPAKFSHAKQMEPWNLGHPSLQNCEPEGTSFLSISP